MTVTVMRSPQSYRCEWLRIDHSSNTAVAVVVAGGVADERAEELWALVEHALEIADGRAVTVDLTGVTGFDHSTIDALRTIVRTAMRRHDDVRILLQSDSGLDHYARHYGLDPRIIQPAETPSSGPRSSEAAHLTTNTRITAPDQPSTDLGCPASRHASARVSAVEVR